MKKGFYFLMFLCAALVVVSCDKTKSYTDMLKAERKAIDRLISDSSFVILKEFPRDSVFAYNEFVKLDNGIYLNIINPGNDERAVIYSTNISTRFDARLFMGSDTASIELLGPHSNGTWPVEFKYGYYDSPLDPDRYYYANQFLSPGLAEGLQYVGDGGMVRLIVPFKQMGNYGYFQSSGIPVFFERVRYTFM